MSNVEKPPIFIKELKDTSVEKGSIVFNLQKELEKVKISIPLVELLKQPSYKAQVS